MVQRFLRQKNRIKVAIIGAILFCVGSAFTSAQNINTFNDYKIGVITTDQQGLNRSVNVRGRLSNFGIYGDFNSLDSFWQNNGQYFSPMLPLKNDGKVNNCPTNGGSMWSLELCYGNLNWSYVTMGGCALYSSRSYWSWGSTMDSLSFCLYNPKNSVLFAMTQSGGYWDRYSPLPLYDGSGSNTIPFGVLSWDYGVFGNFEGSPIVFPYPYKFSAPALTTSFVFSFLSEDGNFFQIIENEMGKLSVTSRYFADLSTSFTNPTSASTALLMWNVDSDVAYAILGPDGTVYFKGYVTDFWSTLNTGQAFADNRFLSWSFQGGQLTLQVMGLNVGGYTQVFSQTFALTLDNSVVLPPSGGVGDGDGGGGGGSWGDEGMGNWWEALPEYYSWNEYIDEMESRYDWLIPEACVVDPSSLEAYSGFNQARLSPNYDGSIKFGTLPVLDINMFNNDLCTYENNFNSLSGIFHNFGGFLDVLERMETLNGCRNSLFLYNYCYALAEVYKGNGTGLVSDGNIFVGNNNGWYNALDFSKLFSFWKEKFNAGKIFFGTFESLTCTNGPMPGLGRNWDFVVFFVFLLIFIPFFRK